MRSVEYLVAAVAASLLSSMAYAADLAISPPPIYGPPPIEDFGGWYLRGDIGFSNQSIRSIRNTNDALYANLLTFNETTAFDTGGTFQLGAGYQFNNWFRADITGQYRGGSNFHGLDLTSFPNSGRVGFGSDVYNASKSEWLFLANAYVDLGTWWGVTPFVGAGIGTSRVTIANFIDLGVTNAGNGAVPSLVSGPTASKWNLAWAVHTGLAYRVTPNVTLELAYSFLNLGDGATGIDSAFDGSAGGHFFRFNDITSHDLKLGMRWELYSPPVYEQPLIRKG